MLQFTIGSEVMAGSLADLNKVINRKSANALLENIYVRMDETGRVTMTAMYDNEYCMDKRLQADHFSGSGCFMANAEQLTMAVKGLPEQDLEFMHDDGRLHIVYKGGELSFDTGKGSEYPICPPVGDSQSVTITSDDLLKGLARVRYAVAHDEVRVIMTGVCVTSTKDELTFAGTDGRMLTLARRCPIEGEFRVVIPDKACDIILTTLKTGKQVHMAIGDERVLLTYGNTEFSTTIHTGAYPNVQGVIPQDSPYRLLVDRKVLLSAVKRVGAFANGTSGLLRVEYADGQLRITGQDNDVLSRTRSEVIPVKEQTMPETLAIGLSAPFLAKVLSFFGEDDVELQMSDTEHPVVFVGDGSTSLLMPMMLQDETKPKPKVEPQADEEDEDMEDEEIDEDVEDVEDVEHDDESVA